MLKDMHLLAQIWTKPDLMLPHVQPAGFIFDGKNCPPQNVKYCLVLVKYCLILFDFLILTRETELVVHQPATYK